MQQDHIVESLWRTLLRYKPPVDPHRVEVHFVPVVPKNATSDIIDKVIKFDPEYVFQISSMISVENVKHSVDLC